MRLLIDADVLLYKAAFRVEQETWWPDDIVTLHMDLDEGLKAFEKIALDWIEPFGQQLKDCFFVASDPTSRYFRHKVDPKYKSARRRRAKPVGIKPLREKINERFQLLWQTGLEADDLIGISATEEHASVIVSVDKDFLTIPGSFWNVARQEMIETSLEEANYNHLCQTLSGDPTDGFVGVPGVGPIGAKKLLKGRRGAVEQWAAVAAAFEKAGLTEIDALRNARLAYILRDGDVVDGEVKLWTPEYAHV